MYRLFVSSPFHGAVQVVDYQIVPLLKALRMPRVNLLIADDVGLGKTIEAGLVLTAMLLRRRVRRVLILPLAQVLDPERLLGTADAAGLIEEAGLAGGTLVAGAGAVAGHTLGRTDTGVVPEYVDRIAARAVPAVAATAGVGPVSRASDRCEYSVGKARSTDKRFGYLSTSFIVNMKSLLSWR